MKKSLLFFFIITILFSLTPLKLIKTVNAQSAEIIFNPSQILIAEQSNFSIQIQTLNTPPFTMFWITVNYNTTAIDALNVSTWPGGYANIDENLGTIDISATTLQPLEGNQTLATIVFKAAQSSNSTIRLTDTQLYDPQNEPIDHITGTAQIEIVGQINLTIKASKEYYYLGENVTIYGNSTVEGSPISSLIGLEVWTREGPKLTRIINSSYIPPTTQWPLTIVSFYPSDEYGNPKSNFPAGYQAYFTITVQNLKNENLPILIVINIFDTYNTIIGFTIFQGTIFQFSQIMFIGPVLIQTSAFNGTATAYANVFSNWPKNQGTPYCPEKSVNFQITGGSTAVPPTFPPSNQTFSAQFNTTFRLPSTGGLAKWEVYATTVYKVQMANEKTNFVAANLFVDDDKPADFNTIQSAINAANDTNTIYIYNGTYYENINVNKTISIVGENAEATIIDGRKLDNVVNIIKSSVKIFDIKILNSSTTLSHDAGISILNYSCKIVGCIITNNMIGIKVQSTNSAGISQNTIDNNSYGIMIINSSNTDLTNNFVKDNSYGIYLLNSSYAKITSSSITNNTYGLTLSSTLCNYNELSSNNISFNGVGITLNYSSYNQIINSNISSNLNYGIWINAANNNQIYSNNFINNSNQVYVSASANQWNISYPQGGNYWDSYNG
ncbi:MAG: NosD domain-containing protein, partial [Candidatus Bathyarchaeia archaeon]